MVLFDELEGGELVIRGTRHASDLVAALHSLGERESSLIEPIRRVVIDGRPADDDDDDPYGNQGHDRFPFSTNNNNNVTSGSSSSLSPGADSPSAVAGTGASFAGKSPGSSERSERSEQNGGEGGRFLEGLLGSLPCAGRRVTEVDIVGFRGSGHTLAAWVETIAECSGMVQRFTITDSAVDTSGGGIAWGESLRCATHVTVSEVVGLGDADLADLVRALGPSATVLDLHGTLHRDPDGNVDPYPEMCEAVRGALASGGVCLAEIELGDAGEIFPVGGPVRGWLAGNAFLRDHGIVVPSPCVVPNGLGGEGAAVAPEAVVASIEESLMQGRAAADQSRIPGGGHDAAKQSRDQNGSASSNGASQGDHSDQQQQQLQAANRGVTTSDDDGTLPSSPNAAEAGRPRHRLVDISAGGMWREHIEFSHEPAGCPGETLVLDPRLPEYATLDEREIRRLDEATEIALERGALAADLAHLVTRTLAPECEQIMWMLQRARLSLEIGQQSPFGGGAPSPGVNTEENATPLEFSAPKRTMRHEGPTGWSQRLARFLPGGREPARRIRFLSADASLHGDRVTGSFTLDLVGARPVHASLRHPTSWVLTQVGDAASQVSTAIATIAELLALAADGPVDPSHASAVLEKVGFCMLRAKGSLARPRKWFAFEEGVDENERHLGAFQPRLPEYSWLEMHVRGAELVLSGVCFRAADDHADPEDVVSYVGRKVVVEDAVEVCAEVPAWRDAIELVRDVHTRCLEWRERVGAHL